MNLRPQAPILLVDDEPANLLALEAVLQELGEPLVRASSGQEALRRLRDADFAAVLLDVRMPGMDGFEAARLIRAQRRSRATPIIFITADPGAVSIDDAYALGAVDFLAKPLMPAVLRGKSVSSSNCIAANRSWKPQSARRCRIAFSCRPSSKRLRTASWPAAPTAC